jgi:23S rRNA pseudouridine1911/1915/1917 synthase
MEPGKTGKEIAWDRGRPYQTEITGFEDRGGVCYFCVRIRRGFRHQIRCHLAWLGYPILGDPLYGLQTAEIDRTSGECQTPLLEAPLLALQAQGLCFRDPASGENRNYSLPPPA